MKATTACATSSAPRAPRGKRLSPSDKATAWLIGVNILIAEQMRPAVSSQVSAGSRPDATTRRDPIRPWDQLETQPTSTKIGPSLTSGRFSMRTKLSVMIAGLGLLLAAVPVLAHHSFAAEFDAKRPVKLQGTVTKMEWINPHAWIYIDVKKPDGKIESWMIEGGTPNTLLRRGFT